MFELSIPDLYRAKLSINSLETSNNKTLGSVGLNGIGGYTLRPTLLLFANTINEFKIY